MKQLIVTGINKAESKKAVNVMCESPFCYEYEFTHGKNGALVFENRSGLKNELRRIFKFTDVKVTFETISQH